MKKTIFIFFLFLSSCAVRSITPGDGLEVNMDFDLAAIDMRHGWQMLSPPEMKYMGVADEESELRGQKTFERHCKQCHGPQGKGDGPTAKKLKIKPANLTKISFDKSNTYLVVQIKKGRNNMPAWQDFLSKKEIFDLSAYIRKLAREAQ